MKFKFVLGIGCCLILLAILPQLPAAIFSNWMALVAIRGVGGDLFSPDSRAEKYMFQYASHDAGVRRLLGWTYLNTGELDRAIDVFSCDVSDLASFWECFFEGKALYESGREVAALDRWRHVSDVDLYFLHLAEQAELLQQKEAMVHWYSLSWRIAPTLVPEKRTMFLHLCRERRQAGAIVQAVEWCERATMVAQDQWVLIEAGQTYYQIKNYKKAEELLRQAIADTPEWSGAYFWLGLTLYRSGRTTDGIAALRTSVVLDPGNYLVHFELANVLAAENKYDSAACEYLMASSLTKDELWRSRIADKIAALPVSIDSINNCQGK